MTKIRVAVVFGGTSGEHSISCATAAGVLREIDRTRFEVVPIGITSAGQWVTMPDDAAAIAGGQAQVPSKAESVAFVMGVDENKLVALAPGGEVRALGAVDVVFPVLHGPFGEDGTIQGLLEMAGVRYVGSGVLASAMGMDKHFMKVGLAAAGIPIGPYVVATARQWRNERESIMAAVAALKFPVFVKPARAGSSLGVIKVENIDGVPDAVAAAQQHDPKVLIEQGLAGRELECGVLEGHGDQPSRSAEIGEIALDASAATFYDYETKYFSSAVATLTCPAEIPASVRAELREMAARAFDALGCEGLARVDFFWDPTEGAVVNEINTMPGFTPISMFPITWAAAGMPYSQLVTELIELALERGTGLR